MDIVISLYFVFALLSIYFLFALLLFTSCLHYYLFTSCLHYYLFTSCLHYCLFTSCLHYCLFTSCLHYYCFNAICFKIDNKLYWHHCRSYWSRGTEKASDIYKGFRCIWMLRSASNRYLDVTYDLLLEVSPTILVQKSQNMLIKWSLWVCFSIINYINNYFVLTDRTNQYLVMVTSCVSIGKIQESEIYRITGTNFISLQGVEDDKATGNIFYILSYYSYTTVFLMSHHCVIMYSYSLATVLLHLLTVLLRL